MATNSKESDWRDINSIDESDDSDTEYIIRRRSKKRKIHRKTTHKKKMRRTENKLETTSSLEETDEEDIDEFAYTMEIHKMLGESLANEGGWILKKGYSSDNSDSISLRDLKHARESRAREEEEEAIDDYRDFYRDFRDDSEAQTNPQQSTNDEYNSSQPNNYMDYTRTRFSDEPLPHPNQFMPRPRNIITFKVPVKKRKDIIKIKQSTFTRMLKKLMNKNQGGKSDFKRKYTRTEMKRLKQVEVLKKKLNKKNDRIKFLEKMVKFNCNKANRFFGQPLINDNDWV